MAKSKRPLAVKFGVILKQTLEEVGITQSELAYILKKSKQVVNHWITGVCLPQIEDWKAIEDVVGKPVFDFIRNGDF